MTTFAYASSGLNLSQLLAQMDDQFDAVRGLERGGTAPTIKPVGLLYDTTDSTILTAVGLGLSEALVRWNGTAWTLVADPTKATINSSGTIAFIANQPMGNHKLTGLAAGSANGDSVRFEQVLLLAGGTMAGDIAMGTHRITGLGAPVSANDAVRKVDLGNGVPPYACWMWYQTNRDALGNSKPIVVQQSATPTTTFTEAERVPRRLRLRLTGTFKKQGGGGVTYPAQSGFECEVYRWNADATGGDSGTATSVTAAQISPVVGSVKMNVVVVWKYSGTGPGTSLGFWLRFIDDNGDYYDLRNSGDTADGTIQAMAWFGEGT